MDSSLSSSRLLTVPPPAPFAPPEGRRAGLGPLPGPSRPRGAVACAARRGGDGGGSESGGRLVDEGMVVLRRRMREMQMAERNYEAPDDWADWEKRYHAAYSADVCRLAGFWQRAMMGTRPTVALGVLALLALSLPASAAVVFGGLVDAVQSMAAAAHLG